MRNTILVLLTLVVPLGAEGATNRVPADYATIQSALDASAMGDTVLVGPGTYTSFTTTVGQANVVALMPDGVVIVGELGAALTTIDLSLAGGLPGGSAAFSCGAHVSGATIIDGFRVIGYPPNSVGVSIGSSATVKILNCIFEVEGVPDLSTERRGIGSRQSDVRVSNCSFIRCAGNSGAAIRDNSGSYVVESCTFIECENHAISAFGDLGAGARFLEVRDCLFERTFSDLSGGAIQAIDRPDGIIVEGCEFREVEAASNGSALSLAGPGEWQIVNNLFVDINMQTGRNVVDLNNGRSLLVAGNTFAYCQQSAGDGVAISTFNSLWTLENNIFAHIYGGAALKVHFGPAAGCNVFWDTPEGVGYNLRPTDRVIDPLFCSPEDRDLTLDQWSPCLPENSLGCGQIGVFGQGCGSVGVTPSTWGRIKATFRDEEE